MIHENFERFCGSPFWDNNLTWHTDNPDLTSCFEQTILVWAPTLFLLLFVSIDLYFTFNSTQRDIPWSWKNISKLIVNGVLIFICIFDFIYVLIRQSQEALVNYVNIYTPIIKTAPLSLCFILILLHKKWGRVSSGLLCSYWFVLCFIGFPQFRTDMYSFQNEDLELPVLNVTYMISYCLCLVMFVLNFFADSPPQKLAYPPVENPCPESSSSFPSRLTYTWFDKLALLGVKRPLVTADLWHLNYTEQTKVVSPLFERHWEQAIAETSVEKGEKAQYLKRSSSVEFIGKESSKNTKNPASIIGPLWKAFGSTFLVGSALKLAQDLLCFISPQILRVIIEFVEGDEPMWRGYFLAIVLFLNTVLQSLILSQYFQKMFLVGLHVRTSLMAAIYRKALRISNASRKESAIGEIVNLMAVDAQRFMDLTNHLNMIWSIPLQIALAVLFLWQLLGPSVLAGLAAMILMIPLNALVANKIEKLQSRQMENKDERIKMMNEILSGIKVLKLYAWEPSFEHIINKIRKREVIILKHIAYYMSSVAISWSITPFLVGFVTFATFVLIDENNVLDAKIAFVSLSLLQIVRVPLAMLPVILMDTIQAWVSVKRINKFLNLEDLNRDAVTHDTNEVDPLIAEKCNFSWGNDEEIILKDISLRVKPGSLVAVVGAVGSGKSSLISAYLGEMDIISGRVNTKGTIAYVPQIAWIQNATLKDNILFGKRLDEKKYKKVIDACALTQDLEMLPGGDSTEIGEKGINLSGGQKQRVSLARAVYHDSDVYLLDDPLSAVDSHVGKHIFQDVIGPTGVLKKKTRLFVTHGITYLPEVDIICVISDRTISEMGTYKELMDKKGAFSDFMMTHLQEIDEEDESEDLNEIKLKILASNPELSQVLAANRSRLKSVSSETGSYKSFKSQRSSDSHTSNNAHFKALEVKAGEKLTEDEKIEVGKVKLSVYKRYFKSVGALLSSLAFILFILYQALAISTNIWLTVWTSDTEIYVNGTQDRSKLNLYLEVYGILGLSQGICSLFTDVLPVLGCWRASVIIHKQLLFSIFRLPLSFFDITPSGRVLARFSKDVDILDSMLPRNVADCCWCLFDTLGTLFIISYSTPIFMATIIPIALVYYFVQKYYIAASRQLNRLESISRSPIYSHFGESVTGTHCIRAYNVEDRFIDESDEKIDSNVMCYYPSLIAQRWLAVRLELVGNLMILFSAIFAVRARGWISSGIVGLSISYSLQVTDVLNWLVRISSEVEIHIVAVERIKEYTDYKQEASWELEGSQVKSDWPERGEVEFRDFKVRYREGLDCVLKGINFSISGGEKVGVVGRTGAGKSSLTLSLFRIIEAAEGSIFIDGVDVSKLGLHTLRARLTIIPQDPVLFSGSLRMNLDPFEKHTDEQVWRALEHAHLKDFVKELNTGLQYEVTEGGENLSVGQRQLVCLARALLRKTKVLVLDEATAAVDLETDDLIQKTIRSEFADCTILTIAHRINTIMDSDRVIVLDKGVIVEFDTPDNLLRSKKSVFYGMAHDAGLA